MSAVLSNIYVYIILIKKNYLIFFFIFFYFLLFLRIYKLEKETKIIKTVIIIYYINTYLYS